MEPVPNLRRDCKRVNALEMCVGVTEDSAVSPCCRASEQMHIRDVQLWIPDRVSASEHHPKLSTSGVAFCKGS